MEKERILSDSHRFFSKCMEIYMDSFPYEERRSLETVIGDLADSRFHFIAFHENGIPVGFFTYWKMDGYIYGEHFAVDGNIRGAGLGSAILEDLKSSGIPVILEVELPETEMAERRIGFYLRNGFVMNMHEHFQPAYHRDCQPVRMNVMTWPEEFSEDEYAEFRKNLEEIVKAD